MVIRLFAIGMFSLVLSGVAFADQTQKSFDLKSPQTELKISGFKPPIAALSFQAKAVTDFTGNYYVPFEMAGRPKPIIKRSGNIKVSCTGPVSYPMQFALEQSGKKLLAYTALGTLRGKVKGKKFSVSGGPSSQKVSLIGKEINPLLRSLGLTITTKLAAGVYCQYRFTAQVNVLY